MKSRRRFCQQLIVSYPLLRSWFSSIKYAHAVELDYVVTLRCFLDIVIPEDITPCATALNVDAEIISKSKRYKFYLNSLTKGLQWMQNKAQHEGQRNFCTLPRKQQEAIVESMAQSKSGSVENIFFHLILDDAFYYYYSHPKSWKGLAYAGPPQPYGFSDYQLPPNIINHGK